MGAQRSRLPAQSSREYIDRERLAIAEANRQPLGVDAEQDVAFARIEVDVESTDASNGPRLAPVGDRRRDAVQQRRLGIRRLAAQINE